MKRNETPEPLFYGRYPSPFGPCWIGLRGCRLARLAFDPGASGGTAPDWTEDPLLPAPERATAMGEQIFGMDPAALGSLPLRLEGSDFQQAVWRALRALPPGQTISYGALAHRIGAPGAARAVGSAVGANPVAYVVPCHRVLRADGGIGGFRWGLALKRALLQAEGIAVK